MTTIKYDALQKGYKLKRGKFDFHKIPDPDKHQRISFIKSGIRIAGYLCITINLTLALSLLIGSEIVGVIEELV